LFSQQRAYLRDIGAEDVVHYDKENVAAKVKNADVVINTAEGQSEAAIAYVKRGGTLFSTANDVPAIQAKCAAAGIHCSQTEGGIAEGPGVQMSELVRLADTGQYKIHVDKVYPLEQTAAAQEDNRKGHTTGKIVVSVTPQSGQR
jgi:NADPH:quinone reductase-like Zn-dependent oxidoreductase